MQKIDLTDIQAQINSRQLRESKPSEQKPLDDEALWNLWEIMTKLFHHAWTSREGEEPTDHWGKLLTELSQDQINSGFDKILDWDSSFPPTVLQFRQLCLPTTISPDGTNSGAYLYIDDPKHPLARDKARMALQSDEQISKKRKAGRSALNNMKELF